jgi:hypothetical protein
MRVLDRVVRFLFSSRRPAPFVERGFYAVVKKRRAGGVEYLVAERY